MRYVSIAACAALISIISGPASAWNEKNCISQCYARDANPAACIAKYNCAQYRGGSSVAKTKEKSAVDAWKKKQGNQ
jgi:hypothetical protein